MERALSRGAVALAAGWALAAPAPLLLAAAVEPLPGSAAAEAAPLLPQALGGVLLLALCGLGPALGGGAAAGGERRWPRALGGLGLTIGAALPSLALSAPWSAAGPGGVGLGALYTLALLLLAAGQAALAGERAPAARAGGWLLACGGLPLLLIAQEDLLGHPPGAWTWLAPPLALGRLLGGDPTASLPALLGLMALALLGLGPFLPRPRPPARTVLALTVLALVGLGGVVGAPRDALAEGEPVQPLLGGYLRPDEPWPLRVTRRGGGPGPLVAARSFGTRVAVPLEDGQSGELPALPQGGGYRVELECGAPGGPWTAGAGQPGGSLPTPTPVGERELLVGCLGPGARALALRLLPGERAVYAALVPEGLPLLARAGEALDLIVCAGAAAEEPLAAACLRTWAAQGGVLLLATPAELERLGGADAAAPGRTQGSWRARPLGAGLLLAADGAPDAAPPPAWQARLTQRLNARARRQALTQAVLDVAHPVPDAALATPLARGALAAALGLLLLAPLARRVDAPTAGAGGLLAGIALALLLRAALAPATPVLAESRQVLLLPAGGRAAQRLGWVTAAAPRPLLAELTLTADPGGPPRPVFSGAAGGLRTQVEVLLGPDTRLRLPLGPAPRTFLRSDAVLLPGPLTVTRGHGGQGVRVENGSGLALRGAFALARGGIYPLGDLPAGAAREFDLLAVPLPYERWRLTAPAPAELEARRIVTAVLAGRDLSSALVLVARLDEPPTPMIAAGAGLERAAPGYVFVEAAAELAGR